MAAYPGIVVSVCANRAFSARFFDGPDLGEPGPVPVQQRWPASEASARSAMWAGAARKR